jgi:mannose-1-phosphate guanylyltransferase
MRRIAVIMAGGSGERFWPLSRLHRPKQLLALADPEQSLLEQTIRRLQPLIQPDDVYVATAPHLVGPSQDFLAGVPSANVLAEPHKRNTGGCLVWVAAQILARDPQARHTTSMAVIAADHRITPDSGFRDTVEAALSLAEQTSTIVTIGIKPSRPETGYGYIELGDGATAGTPTVPIHPVGQFREKPDRATAEEFLATGRFLWNSGTFFWSLDTFLTELEIAAPDLSAAIPVIAGHLARGDEAAAAEAFAELRNVSIDYALLEKARSVHVAEASFEWDDVGAWDALERSLAADENANVHRGESISVDSARNILVNENPNQVVCVLGAEDLVVVVTPDAVLVCPKDRAQQVRLVVDELKKLNIQKF